jgi:ubiquitin carboxyl-terminal hydrolase 34
MLWTVALLTSIAGDAYEYDLPLQFERLKAIRAPCGYVGLKNLSNTCYLNSLFSQLFMNTAFRAFMLQARARPTEPSQNLLLQTQNLFSHLQNSIRRFVDPAECVATIRTYEDAQIDIHNQMDVDEFYNLLFDRWESQFVSSDAKAAFRSFYGGQLVQQVTSRECNHVSERLEPFSAIQCDIKGKSNLQESLQAYVDGEIMEGDNKYKCSTCDRHVDAVKRACLRDIPDNLIFHLKRFDFNLRTLQRSKINDYFTFPNRIDMRPYTIAQLSSPSESMAEDMFELVGVLVHSGTAESGHYYSYIRERPTRSSSEAWFEFNDDVVSDWDPANLEGSCFGGPDYRPPFDGNGIVYDKAYSAYMLFYQRSSALREQDLALQTSDERGPWHVRLPRELSEHIANENVSILRRHCLFDSAHVDLVGGAIVRAKPSAGEACSKTHQMESLAIRVALNHLDQVFSRAKDVPHFERLFGYVASMVQHCARCSLAVFEYFDQCHTPMRMLIQRNAEPAVRQSVADLIISALRAIKESFPDQYGLSPLEIFDGEDFDRTAVGGMIKMFRALWGNFHVHLRSWSEVFGFMLSFTHMGPQETLAFLETEFLRNLLLVVSADPSLDLPAQFVRMVQTVQRRLATRTISYEAILSLLGNLLSKMRLQSRTPGQPVFIGTADDRRLAQQDGYYCLSRPEQTILYMDWTKGGSNIFVEKLIELDQNHEATAEILVTLLQLTRPLEARVLATLKAHITGQITGHPQAPFLRAARVFCRYASRPDMIESLIEHVCLQCIGLQNAEGKVFAAFLQTTFAEPRENSGETAAEVELQGYRHLADWVPGLLGYYDDAVNARTEEFLSDKLFRYGVSPLLGEDDVPCERVDTLAETSDELLDAFSAPQIKSHAMDEAARAVGMSCLQYLKENYVARRVNIGARLVAPLQRVIQCCDKYFDLPGEDVKQLADDYSGLKQGM